MPASSSQPACHDALFELGMEECPAPLLPQLAASLKAQMRAALDEAGFTLDAIQSYHTPRRLALLITQLAEQQPSRNVARKGPAVAQAFDEDGSPRPQALGFARSCGVSVEDLTHVDGRLFYESIEAGKTIQSVLPDLLAEALKRLPLPKTMRWGTGETRFIRPVHSLLLMYGPTCVPCTLLGLDAGTDTFGHRFLAPHALPLSAPSDYLRLLEEEGFVLADPEARMARIKTQLAACTPEGARMHCDEALLTEVNGLVEWPVAHVGTFDPAFLALPKEVLITSMQSHQRYFPVFKAAIY
jgi:glycyl-tRNA synthetase beta chain